MTTTLHREAPVKRPDRFFIGGEWVKPSSSATFDVIEPATEQLYFSVAEATEADIDRAVAAAREAFDSGPWRKMTHAQRAEYLMAIAAAIRDRSASFADIWPRQSGVLAKAAAYGALGGAGTFDFYAGLADTYPFDEVIPPTSAPGYGILSREPVGVVGAIIPWNAPMTLITNKLAPALLAGCTVVLKCSPEAPGEGYLMAEIAEAVGLPPGVLNVVTADRGASEALVTDGRVDKISFTGSTAAGKRIASLCGERIARVTLELGGKSAAVVLPDADIAATAATLVGQECFLTGQVCASLTRVIVTRDQHDELVAAMASRFEAIRVGDPFDENIDMGPLAISRQLERVQHYIKVGVDEGAQLVTGGGRPSHLDRGWFVEPTIFANVSNDHTIAREEIFGPVLSVIPAEDEADALRIANDSPYGLNASVFTEDTDRALSAAREIRSGTVGHNRFRTDFGVAFGGFKQSGIGREGGKEGLLPYLETKYMILEDAPSGA